LSKNTTRSSEVQEQSGRVQLSTGATNQATALDRALDREIGPYKIICNTPSQQLPCYFSIGRGRRMAVGHEQGNKAMLVSSARNDQRPEVTFLLNNMLIRLKDRYVDDFI